MASYRDILIKNITQKKDLKNNTNHSLDLKDSQKVLGDLKDSQKVLGDLKVSQKVLGDLKVSQKVLGDLKVSQKVLGDSKNSQTPPKITKPQNVNIGSIFCHNGFTYVCTGFYHSRAKLRGLKQGELADAGGIWAIEYDVNAPNYVYAKAIFHHQNRWYFIPSTFSSEGTIELPGDTLATSLNYHITFLDEKICREVCPGYLDS